MSTSRTRYGLALASAATLASLSCGALVGAAVADPGNNPQGDHGRHLGQVKHDDKSKGKKDKDDKAAPGDRGQAKGHDKDKDHGNGDGHGNGHGNGNGNGNGQANGHAHAPGQEKQDDRPGNGDPAGNNGTVKIAAPSDAVGHPSNNPHPGCTVVVEWFGFDAGDDVVSTVSFAPHAPTSDAVIGGTSPSSVFVGGDAASGGTDLDGRQAYTLTFEGEPHPKQGFHVKLTVATPHSLGNDTKSKVFWVEPCATSGEDQETQDSAEPATATQDEQDSDEQDSGVLGTSAEADTNAEKAVADDDAAVPTSVDAGEDGSVVPDWARSPLPLVLVAGGLTLAGVAIARRSRAGA